LFEKFNEKADSLIKHVKNISNKKNNHQKQQHQVFLSIDRFDNTLQIVKLTIVSESNRLSLMQKVHDQLAFNYSKINKTIKILKKNHR
jgi:hypothetical protein